MQFSDVDKFILDYMLLVSFSQYCENPKSQI